MFGKVKSGARDAAASGKDKATSALSEVSAMVGNVAGALDDKVGPQYGDYARKAADAGVMPVRLEVEDLSRRVERVEKQVPEIQADIRALYKAVMTGARQERLEQPAPRADGGP
jgi:hypothetical protein